VKIVDISEYWSERGGGVRSYLQAKARHLSGNGCAHRVLAPGPRDEEGPLVAGSDASLLVRYRGASLPYDPSYHLLSRVGDVARRVTRERPDVLEIHSPELAAVSALSVPRSAYRVRTLLWHSDHIDAVFGHWLRSRLGPRSAKWLTHAWWRAIRALASRCHATVCASAVVAAKLRARGIPRVVEVPFGVDTRCFRPEERSLSLRRELLGSERGRLLVAAGRFALDKQWDVLIEGVLRLPEQHAVTLLLIGDGPERERLLKLAGHSPRIRFQPFQKNRTQLARLLASADALVHPSPVETFCFVAADAVASGTPLVVPDAGAAFERRVVGCSEVFRAGSPISLTLALERLFARDPEELRARAVSAAASARSEQQHFDDLLSLYGDLLRSPTGRDYSSSRLAS
jgi:alpha-1,6-mannosyltransferase